MSDEQKTNDYVVNRPFKYGGEMLKRGDPWQPGEGKFDQQIINAGHVIPRRGGDRSKKDAS